MTDSTQTPKALHYPDLVEQFDRACKAVEGAFHTSQALLKFLKLIAKQESEYARSVLGSSRDDKKLFQTCNGTVGAAWLMMFNSTTSGATERQNYAQQLRDNVCGRLSEKLDTLSSELKAAETDGYRGVSDKVAINKAKNGTRTLRGNVALMDPAQMEEAIMKANNMIAAALSSISSIERRRIVATNEAVTLYIDLTRKFRGTEDNRLNQISESFALINIDEDEVSLCQKIASEAHAAEMSAGSAGGAGGAVDDASAMVRRNLDRMKNAFDGEGRFGKFAAMVKKTATGSGSDASASAGKPRVAPAPQITNSFQGVFGVGLEDFMAKQHNLYPNLDVPVWLPIFRDMLTRLEGESSEGLFRVSGGQHGCNMHKEMMCAPLKFASAPGAGDGTKKYFRGISLVTNVAVVTSTFKNILRELPVPVVPAELYNTFVDGQYPKTLTPDNFEEKVLNLIKPASHRNTFIFVIGYAKYLTQFVDKTKMNASNLAMIFGPCLLRCPTENPAMLLKYYDMEKLFTQTCINLMPDHFYTDLNTKVDVRPDGSKYYGKGFEFVKTDPLAIKHSIEVPDDAEEDVDPEEDENDEYGEKVGPKPLPKPGQLPQHPPGGLPQPPQSADQDPNAPPRPRFQPPNEQQQKLASELSLRMGGRKNSTDEQSAGGNASDGMNKLSAKQSAASKEISDIRSTYDSILNSLREGNKDSLQSFSSATQTLVNTLKSFSNKALGCSESELLKIREAPDFKEIDLYEIEFPNARQEAMRTMLCDSARDMHVQLIFIKQHLDKTTSAIDASLIFDNLRSASRTYSSAVSSLLSSSGKSPAQKTPAVRPGNHQLPKSPAPPRPGAQGGRPLPPKGKPIPPPPSQKLPPPPSQPSQQKPPVLPPPPEEPKAPEQQKPPVLPPPPEEPKIPEQPELEEIPEPVPPPAPVAAEPPECEEAPPPTPTVPAPPIPQIVMREPEPEPPEIQLCASLLGFGAVIEEARLEGEGVVAQFQSGALSSSGMADFVRRIRPVIVFENELLSFAKKNSVAIELLCVPQGDPNLLETKLQLMLFHLTKCSMMLNCTVKFIQAHSPLSDSLKESFSALIDVGSTLFA